jgi:hypothetical protein
MSFSRGPREVVVEIEGRGVHHDIELIEIRGIIAAEHVWITKNENKGCIDVLDVEDKEFRTL